MPNTADDPDRTEAGSPPPSSMGIPRPPSVGGISSRVTDVGSEDGENLQARTESRPNSRPTTSRRGPPPTRSYIPASAHASSRPTSSASRISRTHVPSLAAQGFFRPMSSQRLQAHRGRPMTRETAFSSDEGGDPRRRSLVSDGTFGQESALPVEQEVPPSRGTEFTDPILPDRGTSNASPTAQTTARSLGESAKLLHDRDRAYRPAPTHLNLSAVHNNGGAEDPAQKSPLSFLSFQHRSGAQEHGDSRGHERLSSGGSSHGSLDMKKGRVPNKKLGRNYQYFPGNTIFWGGGRFQNSRDKPINIATGLLVIVPTALFFGFSAPWLWLNISPAIPILFAYLFLVCFSSFVHGSLVDPGIVPRNLHQMPPTNPAEDPLALGPATNDWVMVKLATSEVAAMDVPVKYCKTCNLWRPPRSYHCRVCDNCIETLDHHCVWLNNCVGRRNYRYFFSFVTSSTLLALFLIGASLAHILVYMTRENISFSASIDRWRVPFAMVIYGAIAGAYPASLWAYHLWLMGRGETTREALNSQKFAKADRHRPFTQGNIVRNWIATLTRPRPPTYMQFTRPYQEGDQRLATQKRKYRVWDVESHAGIEMQSVQHGQQG